MPESVNDVIALIAAELDPRTVDPVLWRPMPQAMREAQRWLYKPCTAPRGMRRPLAAAELERCASTVRVDPPSCPQIVWLALVSHR